MPNAALTLHNILHDLEGLLSLIRSQSEWTTYDSIQSALTWTLSLNLINYVRFLEAQEFIVYDRIEDSITLTPEGDAALQDPHQWSTHAQEAFDEYISEAHDEVDSVDESAPMRSPEHGEPSDALDQDDGINQGLDPLQPKPIPEPEMNHNAPHPTHQEAPMSTDSFPRSDTNPNAQALSSGDSGAFERMEVIGSGGIGTVYHGRQTRLVREVAIKEIRDIFHVFADVQREDIISRFVDIVQTQSKLNHANIIQLLDVIPDAEYPFVVMEYAPNGNLRRLIETEGHPPLKIAMRYFLQALHALNTAHDKGITHGGIKPENVVLDASGNAKLTDFGIYGVVQRAHSTGNQVYIGVGTVAYMSPEQFRDPSISTVRSDIYSLGIMFYEMLTGKVPGRRSPMPSSFYPDIPRKLDDIFDRMSMDSEDDRFESIDEIFRELYNSAEVMNILDKRSGVLFLRDPFVHGFSGLGAEADAATETPAYDEALDEHRDAGAGLGAPADSSTLTGDQSTAGEGMADEASNTAEGFAAPARDIAGEVEELIDEDADVLDKLHKYSSLFDDHSEEES